MLSRSSKKQNYENNIIAPTTRILIVLTLFFALNLGDAFQPTTNTFLAQRKSLASRQPKFLSQLYDNHKSQKKLCVASQHCQLTTRTIPSLSSTSSIHLAASNNFDISSDDSSRPPPPPQTRATAVYFLLLSNFAVFIMDKVLRYSFIPKHFYLYHRRWKWYQLLTSTFCHGDRIHLSNNLFLLLLFGRSVEDDLGWGGLLFSYIFCGMFAGIVSIMLSPPNIVSIGASGAVFGLFAISTLSKFSWREVLDWRKMVELVILGQFVLRQLADEIQTVTRGGTPGVGHVAHLAGAAGGAIMVFAMRMVVSNFERAEKEKKKKQKKKLQKKKTL